VTETTAKAWSAAGELVVQHRQALERLALHLVDAGEMSGAEVDAVLGDLRPPQGIATKREHALRPSSTRRRDRPLASKGWGTSPARR